MSNPDPCFSRHSPDGREEVFEQLNKALNEMGGYGGYRPPAGQGPYWKFFVYQHLEFEPWAFHSGLDDYYFPESEECLKSALRELQTLKRITLLDPRLQIEVVAMDG